MIIGMPNIVNAATTVSLSVMVDGQYMRHVVTIEEKWTPENYLEGQPTKGTYLLKGDFLYYSESSGTPIILNIGIGYKVGNSGISIPLGKVASTATGVGKVAPSDGYYKIKSKKM